MPPGKEWRTGADEATTLKTDRTLRFGTAGRARRHLPDSLRARTAVVAAHHQQEHAGVGDSRIPAGQDLGRTPMTATKTAAPVEQLTISIDDTPAGATLRIEWGTVSARAPFTVGM